MSTDPEAPDPASSAFTHCKRLVRAGDPDRFYAALLAPPDKQPLLHALFAFNLEIARIRESVSEPLPGEIRLQWWRDALSTEAAGDAQANPVAAGLALAIEAGRLPREALLALIEARVFDLYDDPMPSLNDLEGYCGETSSALIRLAALILEDGRDPGAAEAAGHGGVAYAVTGLLRAFPWHARRGQVYLPKDILDRHGVTRDDIVLGRGGPGVLAALAEMRTLARSHLAKARAAPPPPGSALPAFLPLVLVEPYLAVMERGDYDPYRSVVDIPGWRKLARLWWAARRGRF